MASAPDNAPLVVIIGETASGKSALAIELALAFSGEIICADSRTVYEGLDIGTAKPTKSEQVQVPHHLLDVVTPDQNFTVADFKQLANEAITAISDRGKLPVMVGGTGLYIDSVLYDYQFAGPGAERDPLNPRHLKSPVQAANQLRSKTLVIGLQLDRDELERRITERVEAMVEKGFVDEVKAATNKYGQDSKAFLAPGYKAFIAYINNELDLEQAKQQFVKADLQLAKRQRTWFKRNKSIHWLSDLASAKTLVQNFLSKQA